MPEAIQIEYESTIYDIKDVKATAKLEELLNKGDFFKRLCNQLFPISSIVIRYDSLNPGDIYGGTWIELPDGALRNTKNNTLLQKVVGTDTTKITVGQLPSHNHPFTKPRVIGKVAPSGAPGNITPIFWRTQTNLDADTFYLEGGEVGFNGNGEDFSLMQRSIYVKAWVRTHLYEG